MQALNYTTAQNQTFLPLRGPPHLADLKGQRLHVHMCVCVRFTVVNHVGTSVSIIDRNRIPIVNENWVIKSKTPMLRLELNAHYSCSSTHTKQKRSDKQ